MPDKPCTSYAGKCYAEIFKRLAKENESFHFNWPAMRKLQEEDILTKT